MTPLALFPPLPGASPPVAVHRQHQLWRARPMAYLLNTVTALTAVVALLLFQLSAATPAQASPPFPATPTSSSHPSEPRLAQAVQLLQAASHAGSLDQQVDEHDDDLQLLQKPPLFLGEGEQRLFQFTGLAKFSLGGPAVRALPLPAGSFHGKASDYLLLKGVSAGRTDLWVWKKDGTVENRTLQVEKTSPLPQEKNSELQHALGLLQATEIILTGPGVILRGPVDQPGEAARIAALVQAFPEQVHNETTPSERFLQKGQTALAQFLKKNQLEKLKLERLGQTLWVRGVVDNPKNLDSLKTQLRGLYPLLLFELDTLPDQAPTLIFKVFLLELKKKQFSSLGIQWSKLTALPLQLGGPLFNQPINLDLAISELEGHGHARVLSNPELAVRAPGTAELFAGGEIPIQLSNRLYSNVTWKKFGLTLKLKILHSIGDRIRLEVFAEVSHLDPSLSQNEIPGIQKNCLNTQVDASLGVPLLLSGLLQQDLREQAKGLPFLRHLPVLGSLFGSEDYLNARSELVAILYPLTLPKSPPSLASFIPILPKGPLPPPRNWLDLTEESRLKNSDEYPWNAFP